MAEVNKELEQTKAENETVKAELDATKAENEELKAELEKLKAKTEKKNAKNSANSKVAQQEEMVPVFLIKTKEKKDDFFCAVNGRTYQIKRGEQVMVPKSVQEIIKHQNQMDQVALENLEKANRKFAEE